MIRDLLSIVGGIVVGVVVYQILKEVVRAFRQGRRLAWVYARASGKRKPSLKWVLKSARNEFCSSYDWVTVSVWKVPHNPGKPIRRAWEFGRY